MRQLKKILVLLSFLTIAISINSQTGFITNRNWLIGKYVGQKKDSTNHSPWTSYTLTINYCTNFGNFHCDSMAGDNFSPYEFYVYCDSSIHDLYGNCNIVGTSPTYGGKLYADSTYVTWVECLPVKGCGTSRTDYFVGKKVESFVGNNELVELLSGLTLYPNPSKNILYTHLNNIRDKEFIYELYNITGAMVKRGLLPSDGSVTLNGMETGMYFIMIRNGGHFYKGIFLKE